MTGVPVPPAADPAVRADLVLERLDRLRAALRRAGADAALLDGRGDTAWVTAGAELHVVAGAGEAASPVLVTLDRAVVIAPDIEADRVRDEELGGLPLDLETVPWHEPAGIEAAVARLAGPRIVLAGSRLAGLVAPLRPRLAPLEHDRMRWLAEVARAALDAATRAMTPGRTESEVVAGLVGPLAASGVRAPVVLAAADERMRYRHPLPGAARLRDRLMLVLVAERWGLHVAATRMAWLSGPDDSPHPADAAAARVLGAMREASLPGATLGDVLAVAADAYASEGLEGEWRHHHQGGTIGYAPRERIATPGDPTVLEPGMAVAWNPSVPGGKAEATLLLGDDGPETLPV